MWKKYTSRRRRVSVFRRAGHYAGSTVRTTEPGPGCPDLRQQRLSGNSRSSGRQRRSQPNAYRMVGDQGSARRSLAALLRRASLYFPERRHRLQPGSRTGTLLFSGRLGAMGYYYASPVAADRKVFIASEEGVVVVLEAGDQLNVLARNKLDGAILATPAIVDGKIYLRTESHLYTFGN